MRWLFSQRARRTRRARFGALVLALLSLLAIFADLLAGDAPLVAFGGPHGLYALPGIAHESAYAEMRPDEIAARFEGSKAVWPLVRFGPERESSDVLEAPSRAHPLGTDERGRDLFARLAFGARTALGLSLVAVALSTLLGVVLGGAAGFVSRRWDTRLERFVQTVDTFPVIIVVALVRAIEGKPSALSLIIAVSFVRSAEVARLVRATALRASAEDYVLAARALGCSRRRVFSRHILPNVIGPVLVSAAFGIASIALLESAVSFLELGSRTRVASWGETLAEAARHPAAASLLVGPAILLFFTVGACYLVADALRDAFDARTPPREQS